MWQEHFLDKAKRIQEMFILSTLDVIVEGHYSNETLKTWERYDIMPKMTEEELTLIKDNPAEFIGFSYYCSRLVNESTSEDTNPEELIKLLTSRMTNNM